MMGDGSPVGKLRSSLVFGMDDLSPRPPFRYGQGENRIQLIVLVAARGREWINLHARRVPRAYQLTAFCFYGINRTDVLCIEVGLAESR